MKVILREEIERLGNAGDLVTVKDGYAHNYLIPRQLAVRADSRNVKALEHERRIMEARRTKLRADAETRLQLLEGVGRLVMTRSCGPDGKLFGSVTTMDITRVLAEKGAELDKRQVKLREHIKALGDYDIPMSLGQGVLFELKLSVEPDENSAKLIQEAAQEAAERAAERAARGEDPEDDRKSSAAPEADAMPASEAPADEAPEPESEEEAS